MGCRGGSACQSSTAIIMSSGLALLSQRPSRAEHEALRRGGSRWASALRTGDSGRPAVAVDPFPSDAASTSLSTHRAVTRLSCSAAGGDTAGAALGHACAHAPVAPLAERHLLRPRGARHRDVHLCPEVEAWVLGFGDEAEVIGPPELRERVARKARAMAQRYEGVPVDSASPSSSTGTRAASEAPPRVGKRT
ncbi:WYL domain-containing protein [Vitiosangium sp. GDMCC 1.1324]|uniref:WYL domain-containing protein n=1 Tax=Vitiosangium sp. (strain GDMCC 1.1324) TaxID=2138576 RepID=UPI000D35721C|nr:hypothetical protein DAT35_54875 [Vitiosangium sp. GDMCC 1.1324]